MSPSLHMASSNPLDDWQGTVIEMRTDVVEEVQDLPRRCSGEGSVVSRLMDGLKGLHQLRPEREIWESVLLLDGLPPLVWRPGSEEGLAGHYPYRASGVTPRPSMNNSSDPTSS